MKAGLVYVATKQDRYVEEAFLSACSAKRHAPRLHVTLFTDRPAHPLCGLGGFDSVVGIESQGGYGLAWAEGQLDRILCLRRSPYERTLHIDADSRVASPAVAGVFRHLDDHDVALVEARHDISYSARLTARRMFNAGFLLYRQDPRVDEFLRQWEALTRRNFQLALAADPPAVPALAHLEDPELRRELLRMDQTSLMEILSPEVDAVGLRCLAMDDAWMRRGAGGQGGNITHAEQKGPLQPELLQRARDIAEPGATKIYDYVASREPPMPARPSLLPWKRKAPGVREAWESADALRADLHLRYGQTAAAAAHAARLTEPFLASAMRARLALRAGKIPDAVEAAAQAVQHRPQSAYAAQVLGEALIAARRPVDALPHLERAFRDAHPGAGFLLGQAWFALNEYGKAATAWRGTLELEPGDHGAANNMLPALLGARRYPEVCSHADRLLASQPGHTAAAAFKWVALGELGRADELKALADQDRLIVTERVEAPKGFRSVEAFNHALAQAVSSEGSLAYEPEHHATRKGHHSGNLAGSTQAALKQLNAACIAAAERRMRAIGRAGGHPFEGSVPRVYSIHSWAVVMREAGHQTPHIHASGWLSGVYYIEVPPEVRADDPERNGWLEFGRSEERWHRPGTVMPLRQVLPEPGLLVTFPSYFWHNTRPLRSSRRRISFAFDIVPA